MKEEEGVGRSYILRRGEKGIQWEEGCLSVSSATDTRAAIHANRQRTEVPHISPPPPPALLLSGFRRPGGRDLL